MRVVSLLICALALPGCAAIDRIVGRAPAPEAAAPAPTQGDLEAAYRGQLDRLQPTRDGVSQAVVRYATDKAAILSGLQAAPGPGDPALQARWAAAQAALTEADAALGRLSALYAETAGTLQAAQSLPAGEPRAALVAELTRLMEIVAGDLQRQTAVVAGERTVLTALSAGIARGETPRLPAVAAQPAQAASTAPAPPGARAPFVTIRFDRPDTEYEDALFVAIEQALAARPNAEFDVVAVAPTPSGADADAALAAQRAARGYATRVMTSMTDMGLQAGRIRVSSVSDPQAAAAQVLIYLR